MAIQTFTVDTSKPADVNALIKKLSKLNPQFYRCDAESIHTNEMRSNRLMGYRVWCIICEASTRVTKEDYGSAIDECFPVYIKDVTSENILLVLNKLPEKLRHDTSFNSSEEDVKTKYRQICGVIHTYLNDVGFGISPELLAELTAK